MGKKLALNVVYNVGIFLCLVILFEGIKYSRYEYVAGALFIGVVLAILKIRLIKDLSKMQK